MQYSLAMRRCQWFGLKDVSHPSQSDNCRSQGRGVYRELLWLPIWLNLMKLLGALLNSRVREVKREAGAGAVGASCRHCPRNGKRRIIRKSGDRPDIG